MKLLKIGELAKMTDISVRTLHHYESIGLLYPHSTNHAGHRFYGPQQIEELQKIMSLKNLGISLKEMTNILKDKCDLNSILELHHKAAGEKLAQLQKIEKILSSLVQKFAVNKEATSDKLIKLIKGIRTMENWEKFYSPEQILKLKGRYEKYPDQVKEVSSECPKIFKKFEEAMNEGLKPESDEVQSLAKRAQHFIELFTGGGKEIEKSLDEACKNPANKEQALKDMRVSEEIFDYANLARAYFNKNHSK